MSVFWRPPNCNFIVVFGVKHAYCIGLSGRSSVRRVPIVQPVGLQWICLFNTIGDHAFDRLSSQIMQSLPTHLFNRLRNVRKLEPAPEAHMAWRQGRGRKSHVLLNFSIHHESMFCLRQPNNSPLFDLTPLTHHHQCHLKSVFSQITVIFAASIFLRALKHLFTDPQL